MNNLLCMCYCRTKPMMRTHSFVQPFMSCWLPAHKLVLGKPQIDFFLCTIDSITTVTNISEIKKILNINFM